MISMGYAIVLQLCGHGYCIPQETPQPLGGGAPIAMVPPTRTSYKTFGHVCISRPKPTAGLNNPLPPYYR